MNPIQRVRAQVQNLLEAAQDQAESDAHQGRMFSVAEFRVDAYRGILAIIDAESAL